MRMPPRPMPWSAQRLAHELELLGVKCKVEPPEELCDPEVSIDGTRSY